MAVAVTSLLALITIQGLGDKTRQVFEFIKENQPCHNQQIADGLNWPINCVTGRVDDLRKMKMAQFECYGLNHADRKVKCWSVSDPGDWLTEKILKEKTAVDQDGVRV